MKITHFFGLLLLACCFILGCTQFSSESQPKDLSHKVVDAAPSPEIPQIMDIPIAAIPISNGFDFPVGPPDAKGYYNAQGFQGETTHLGEDWNGVGGGNTDLGDPVYAIANGIVALAEDWGGGWGNVLRVFHNIGSADKPNIIESFYAHLDTMIVQEMDSLKRGQQIGTIGDAYGAYPAHLHFEMRWKAGMLDGGGYSEDTTGFLNPTKFIKAHRGE